MSRRKRLPTYSETLSIGVGSYVIVRDLNFRKNEYLPSFQGREATEGFAADIDLCDGMGLEENWRDNALAKDWFSSNNQFFSGVSNFSGSLPSDRPSYN